MDQNAAGSSTVVMYIEKLVDWWRVVCTRAVMVSLFPFPVQLRSVFAKKLRCRFFTVSVFSYKYMSIVLHITFVENDQTYYFASNHTPDGQHCYVRL